ncbi:hypothetical protein GCM10017750_34000 [Streptomyces racemochromogenes]
MRCVIARFPFDLTKSGVLDSMKGVKPEEITSESVIIGRRAYPVKQVGQVITGQDRRDFTAGSRPGHDQARFHLPRSFPAPRTAPPLRPAPARFRGPASRQEPDPAYGRA